MLTEKAIVAISGMAAPIVFLIAFMRVWPTLKPLFDRRNLRVKVAGFEIDVADATENIGKQVADLQQKIAELEQRLVAGDKAIVPLPEPVPEVIASVAKSVLWVDDVPSNNAFLIDKLERDGVKVVIATSTEEGLRRFSVGNFAALISDLGRQENGRMNQFAGLDLVNEIRSKGKDIPIMIFGARRALQHTKTLKDAGANEVTASAADVLSFVERHVSGKAA